MRFNPSDTFKFREYFEPVDMDHLETLVTDFQKKHPDLTDSELSVFTSLLIEQVVEALDYDFMLTRFPAMGED